MNARHTPGPWRVGRDNPLEISAMYDEFRSRGMLYPWAVVARVHAVADAVETRRADAHLIAAAPDLLDALERITEATTLHGGSLLALEEEIVQARAALARARGEVKP